METPGATLQRRMKVEGSMKNRRRDLGQDRRGGVVVETDHREHASPGLGQPEVQSPRSKVQSGLRPRPELD